MNHTRKMLFAALVVAAVSPLRAQDTTGKVGVGGVIGAAIPVGSRYVKDNGTTDFGAGGFVKYGLMPHWSAAIGYDNLNVRNNIRVEPITVSAIYNFCAESRWTPFLQAGWGVASGQGAKNFNDLAARAGLGAEFFALPNLSISALVNYFYVSKTGDAQNEASIVKPGVALTYYFGAMSAAPAKAKPVEQAKVVAPKDSDNDGVTDDKDQCPGTPSGTAVDENGCAKVIDSDGDGIADSADKCPNTPAGAKVDANGCPLDTDGDGVADYLDKCPDTPKGAAVNTTGCTALKPSEKVSIELNVLFDTGKADVKPQYDAEIKRVADFMGNYPETTAEIEGHTDNVGSEAANVALSQRRADSVKNYLVSKFGVDAKRLSAKGYGPKKPIASNDDAPGRAKNRRVVATLTATKQ